MKNEMESKIFTIEVESSRVMIPRTTAAFIAVAAIGLGIGSAQARPCSSEIAWFEQAVRRSAGNERGTFGAAVDRRPARSPADAGVGQAPQ